MATLLISKSGNFVKADEIKMAQIIVLTRTVDIKTIRKSTSLLDYEIENVLKTLVAHRVLSGNPKSTSQLQIKCKTFEELYEKCPDYDIRTLDEVKEADMKLLEDKESSKKKKSQRRPMPYGFVAWCSLWICVVVSFCSLMTEAHNSFDIPENVFEEIEEVVAQKTPVVHQKKSRKAAIKETVETDSIAEVVDYEEELVDSTSVLAETVEETDTLKTDTVKKQAPVVPVTNDSPTRDLAIVTPSQKATVEICGAMKQDGTICVRQTDGGLCEEHKY